MDTDKEMTFTDVFQTARLSANYLCLAVLLYGEFTLAFELPARTRLVFQPRYANRIGRLGHMKRLIRLPGSA